MSDRCPMCHGAWTPEQQTPQQKLSSLYASLGLNLRDNDPESDEMQAAAMEIIEAYRRAEWSIELAIRRRGGEPR